MKPPVPLQGTAEFGDGVTAHVITTASVTSSGEGPGEISGAPAVAFTIALDNGSTTPVSLDLSVVTATYGLADVPAPTVDGPPTRPFSGTVAPGAESTAVYVFRIPAEERSRVSLSLSYSAGRPVVVFTGSGPA